MFVKTKSTFWNIICISHLDINIKRHCSLFYTVGWCECQIWRFGSSTTGNV